MAHVSPLARRILSFILLTTFLTAPATSTAQSVHENYMDGRIFVKVEQNVVLRGESGDHGPDDVDPRALRFLDGMLEEYRIDSVTRPFHALQGEAPDLKRTYRVHFEAAEEVDAFVEDLEERSAVDYAEKEPLMELTYNPNDPYYANNNMWYMSQINAANAWDISFGSSNVVVAVTDNAIDTSHTDLNGALWQNPGEIPNNGLDDDGNGRIDDYRGWDVADNDGDPSPANNSTMHGTHTSGSVGAVTDNNTGVASIGFGVSVMAVKISWDGT